MRKKIFLDTNIVIDYLSNRIPFGEDALRIFSLPPQQCQLCISALSFTTIFYVLRKHFNRSELLEMLNSLKLLVEVLPTDEDVISSSLQSDFSDFEDAVQYHTALYGNASFIITRNTKDFGQSTIPVYTPSEFLQIPYWINEPNPTVLNEPEVEYYINPKTP